MTDSLRAGTALVTIVGRGFQTVNAVHEALTSAFAFAGPMRDQIAPDWICRTVAFRISGPADAEPNQSLPPTDLLDIAGLDFRQARVRVVATSSDDVQAVMAVISAGLVPVGDPIFEADGSVVVVVAER